MQSTINNNTEMSNKEKELAIIEMQEMGNNVPMDGSLEKCKRDNSIISIVFRG